MNRTGILILFALVALAVLTITPVHAAGFTPTTASVSQNYIIWPGTYTASIVQTIEMPSSDLCYNIGTEYDVLLSPYNITITPQIINVTYTGTSAIVAITVLPSSPITISYGTFVGPSPQVFSAINTVTSFTTYTFETISNNAPTLNVNRTFIIITDTLGTITTSTVFSTTYVLVSSSTLGNTLYVIPAWIGSTITVDVFTPGETYPETITIVLTVTVEGASTTAVTTSSTPSIGYTTSAPSFLKDVVNRILSLLFYVMVAAIFAGFLLCYTKHAIGCGKPECHTKFKKCLIRVAEAAILIYVLPHVIDWLLGIL